MTVRALPGGHDAVRPYLLTQFLTDLGPSETKLTERNTKRIKKSFPIAREQEILWADAVFGTRSHGLVLTDTGVFLKDGPSGDDDKEDAKDDGLGYFYLRWENFNPARISHKKGNPTLDGAFFLDAEMFRPFAMACVRINNRRVRAYKAARTAAKGTALLAPHAPIRSVCRSSAKASFEWCLDEDNDYRFLDAGGTPKILEVPFEQYDAVLERMRKLIAGGHVPTVSDTQLSGILVKCGSYSYIQAVNLARTGKIPLVRYNERTGSVICDDEKGLGWHLGLWLRKRMGFGAGTLNMSSGHTQAITELVSEGLALGSLAQAQAGKDEQTLAKENMANMVADRVVSTAGYSLGSTGARVLFSTLGAAAGPLGMIAGLALGDACGKASIEALSMAKELFIEPETKIVGRLLGGVLANIAFEYALTPTEHTLLHEMLGHVNPAILQTLGATLQQTQNQETEIRKFVIPMVEAIRKA